MSNFSLQYWYVICQKGYKKKVKYHYEDTVLLNNKFSELQLL